MYHCLYWSYATAIEFSRNTLSWQCWHQRIKKIFHIFPEFLIKMYVRILGKESFVCNTFEFLVKNDFHFIIWILSDAFELDANVVNFVYYGKTRMLLLLPEDNNLEQRPLGDISFTRCQQYKWPVADLHGTTLDAPPSSCNIWQNVVQ